jgi:hypothetical protein
MIRPTSDRISTSAVATATMFDGTTNLTPEPSLGATLSSDGCRELTSADHQRRRKAADEHAT